MVEVSIYNDNASKQFVAELAKKINNPVFMCIGTDKVFSDSLGPRVGSLLNTQMQTPRYVYGLNERNITAENLSRCYDFIKRFHPESQIVVIDAAVGSEDQIGNVQLTDGGIVPGAATNKNLPEVGDVSIVGIVAERGMADFYTLDSAKERLVNKVASFIANAILSAAANTDTKQTSF